MAQLRNTLAHFIAFAALVSAVGCTSRGTEFPRGVYSAARISEERWEIVFADQGRFHVIRNGKTTVQGRYASTASRIVFSNERGPDACGNDTGTYRWKRSGDMLTLTAVSEPCGGRHNVMQRLLAQK